MCRKNLLYSFLAVCMTLTFAISAQAQVSIGVSIQPFPDAGSNPCTDQLVTNQVYNVTVYASNSSFNGSTVNQIPVYLEGKVTENDACSAVGCPAGTEIPGAIGFLSCTPLDACISNCQETAPGTGIVTFDVAPGCLLLGAGQKFRELVSIDKQALIPSLAGTVDCTLPSDYAKYNMAAKCIDNIGTVGVDCQVRDPQTGQTGTGSGTSEVYFPPAPCIEVTKDCEPDSACFETPITFSGTVTNCGDVDLINLNVADNKGTINGGTCGSILPVGQSCTYSGVYTAPIVIGGNTDTVTATGQTGQGVQVSDTATDTCTQEPTVPGADCSKSCTIINGNAEYDLEFSADEILPCPEGLKNCQLVDNATANGAPVNIIWTPDPANPVPAVPNDGIPFDLAAGQTLRFTGIYSPACVPDQIAMSNTAQIICDNGSKTCTAACTIPPCDIPGIDVTKDCSPKGLNNPQGSITVFGEVKNTGNGLLNNVKVVDNQGTVLTCTRTNNTSVDPVAGFTLASGEIVNCEGTVDCKAGYIPSDRWDAQGESPSGIVVTDSATVPPDTCGCIAPCIVTIDKSCTNSTNGSPIPYTIVVRASADNLFPIVCSITDELISPIPPPEIVWQTPLPTPGDPITLNPGQTSGTYSGTYTCAASPKSIYCGTCPTTTIPQTTVNNTATVKCYGTGIFAAAECENTDTAECTCSATTTTSCRPTTTTTICIPKTTTTTCRPTTTTCRPTTTTTCRPTTTTCRPTTTSSIRTTTTTCRPTTTTSIRTTTTTYRPTTTTTVPQWWWWWWWRH